MSENAIDIYQDIVNKYLQRETTEGQQELFAKTFLGHSEEDIKKLIEEDLGSFNIADKLMEDASDDGGIIAVSGFFFQFLTTIEYLIDLINGKWEYVLVDHHQDIVAFNSSVIRMIQVKTMKLSTCKVSDTELYRSWVPKLLETDNLFENFTQKREFELITNFIPTDSPRVEVEPYLYNETFDLKVSTTFNESVKRFATDERLMHVPQDIDDMLTRFSIKTHVSEDFIYKIKANIGNLFDESFIATNEDIYFIIGFLCSRCYYPKNHQKQLIDKERAEELKGLLQTRIYSKSRHALQKGDSLQFIDDYIHEIKSEFSSAQFMPDFYQMLDLFELELKTQIQGNQNIFSFLGRLVNRMSSSAGINVASPKKITDLTKELLDLMLLLKCIYQCKIEIDTQNNRLLLKDVLSEKFNLFNLEKTKDFIWGQENFKETVKSLSFEQQQRLFTSGMLNVVFTGRYKKSNFVKGFLNEHITSITLTDGPSLEDLSGVALKGITQSKDTYSTVSYEVRFIHGHSSIIEEFYSEIAEFEKFDQYVDYIKAEFQGEST